MQPEVQDSLRLYRREVVLAVDKPEAVWQGIGPGVRLARFLEHAGDGARRPCRLHQCRLRLGRRRRFLDQRDDLVDVGQRNRLPFQHVGPVPRLPEVENRAPRHDLAPVRDEGLEHLLQVEELRLALVQRDHVDAEHTLQRRLLVQVVQHHVAQFAFAQLDHDAHAVLVRLVPEFTDAFDAFLTNQIGNLFDETGFVDLVRQFGDDNGFLAAFVNAFDSGPGAHENPPAARSVGRIDALRAVDDARGRKIRTRDMLDQGLDIDRGIVDERQTGIDDLVQVMWWNVGRHANGDSCRAVDQQIRHPGRHDRRFRFRAVIVFDEFDRVLVDIREDLVRDARHAHFGVTHRGRRVPVHGTEIALPIDQHVSHRKRLRHAHDRVVNRGVSVGMIFTDDVADDARRFLVGLVVIVAEFAHRVQHPPMHRFQSVADIGQRAADDYAHRVIEIGLLHLLFEAYRQNFLRDFRHANSPRPYVSGQTAGIAAIKTRVLYGKNS